MQKLAKQRNARIAKMIARALFTNGANEHAERLVLELKDSRDGGGWCETALSDNIKKVLNMCYPNSK